MNPLSPYSHRDLILYAIKNNCSREIYDCLIESQTNLVNFYLFIYFKFWVFLESTNL